jgi:chromosome segregation ATPase
MTPKELREQYESIVNVATTLMNECKRLESRLSEVEKESERWHSEMLDVSRQLSESQKECERELAEAFRLHKEQCERLQCECDARNAETISRLTAEVERLTSQVKIVEGLKSELAQQAEYHHHKHIELATSLAEARKWIMEHWQHWNGTCWFCGAPLGYEYGTKNRTHPEPSTCIVLKSQERLK